MSKKINFISLGCAKNLVDSEKLMGSLKRAGFEITFEAQSGKFHTVVINTCGFINDAKEESVNAILLNVSLKKAGAIKNIIVMGCLSQRYKDELIKEIPEIDAIFGVNDFDALHDYLKVKNDYSGFERVITTPSHYAYLKIAEGCDRSCSFCAIPSIRGRHTSYTIEKILEEAEYLASKGVKELNVVAQDTTYYGMDIYKKKRLADLLSALCRIKGIEWVRLNYTYPAAFPEDVLKIIADEPKICKYIDIPLQHISDSLLKAMKRGIDKETTVKLIQKIRNTIPDVAIRTSFIVGFPGETKKDFESLVEFIKMMRFDRLGVFKYSHEENTPAFQFSDNVSNSVKEDRYNTLMALQHNIAMENNVKKINKKLKVIIDSNEDGIYSGRTAFDAPEVDNEVIIKAERKLKPGHFYNVLIEDADAYTLYGTAEENK
ncbi:MAG: 30S ribosomal protein S12 methylthiotransferase RimO [Bacteroidales bacterium]|nr:30S ribosomal protein S12 methylthiotransferase RimO [Bacteroidales bacterium]